MKIILIILAFFAYGFVAAQGTIDDIKKEIVAQEYHKAISMASQLVTADTKNADSYFYRGYAYYKLSMQIGLQETQRNTYLEKAKQDFTSGINRQKKNPYNHLGLALHAAATLKFDEAKAQFDKVYEMDGKDVQLVIYIAEGYIDVFNNKKYTKSIQDKAIDEADTKLRQASLIDKNNPNIYVSLGNVNYSRQFIEVAENNYREALKLNPQLLTARFSLAQLLLRRRTPYETVEEYSKRLNTAKDELVEITKQDPTFAPAFNELSQLYYKVNDFKSAEMYANKYLELIGTDKRARVRYAQLLYLIGRFEKAVGEFEKFYADTNNFVISRLYAYSLCEIKKFEKAKEIMGTFHTQCKPEDIIFKDYRYDAMIALNTGNVTGAEQNLEKLLATNPEEVELYKDFYDFYKEKEDWENATRFLKKYLAKKKSPNDLFVLGWTYYAKLKDYVNADTAFKALVSEHPTIIEAHYYLALTNVRLDPELSDGRARPYYERLVEQIFAQQKEGEEKYQKMIAGAYAYLTLCYYKIDQNDKKALAYGLKTLELDPTNEQVKSITDGLKGKGVIPED